MKFMKFAEKSSEVEKIAKKHGVEPAEIEKELKMGRKVESEHRDVLKFFKKLLKDAGSKMPISDSEFFDMIALAHLREMKDYYTRLKKIEG